MPSRSVCFFKAVILRFLDSFLRVPMWLYTKSRTLRIYLRAKLPPRAQVLDVGSGHNPWFRSSVLLDRFVEDSTERPAPIHKDRREFAEGDATNLPFPDKSFDFVFVRISPSTLRTSADLFKKSNEWVKPATSKRRVICSSRWLAQRLIFGRYGWKVTFFMRRRNGCPVRQKEFTTQCTGSSPVIHLSAFFSR